MSYFICGFKTNSIDFNAFESVFSDMLPAPLRNDVFRTKNGPSYAAFYGNKKAIPNVFICDGKDGTWLAAVGTPLIHMKSEGEKQAFLSEFVANPRDSLCGKIDGNFAVIACDALRDRFIAATDYNNTTPIFYANTSKGVFFSSHELPLAKFLGSEIDPFGFSQLIHLGVTWNSHTRFRNIHKTLPCQISVVHNNKEVHVESYWRPSDEAMWDGTFDDQLEKWISLLRNSVWRFYECSDQKPVIADFTAGEDTRLILAQCHALGIPFEAQVTGLERDVDVVVAKQAAAKLGFPLIERRKHWITEELLLANIFRIILECDGYQEIFAGCIEFATDKVSPLDDYSVVKYCGVPGGEAFRGSYYLRGKAFYPSRRSTLDHKFFVRMKYLLDYYPGLLKHSDNEFRESVYKMAEDDLKDVKRFPIGTQIDHLLRVFQTSFLGLKYKNPLYLPLAVGEMTRSIYGLSPRYKQGGKVTKACTEILFPELAFIHNQNGVPTIRKTLLRLPLFWPEYAAVIKKISSGAISRLLKWRQANKWYYSQDLNSYILTTLLNKPPYCNWLSSSQAMITGDLYESDVLNPLLENAKVGVHKYLPILGRIISQELALRWVYDDREIPLPGSMDVTDDEQARVKRPM
jgi:hypothetical protein